MDDAENSIRPLTLGLICDPPSLIIIYTFNDGTFRKTHRRRRRRIPLRNFSDKSDLKKFIFMLRQRHTKVLECVPHVTLEKSLLIIQAVQCGTPLDEAVRSVEKEFEVDGNEDLNLLGVEELSRKKQLMEETFQKTLLRPGDSGYVYDKEVIFQPTPSNTNAWDDELDISESALNHIVTVEKGFIGKEREETMENETTWDKDFSKIVQGIVSTKIEGTIHHHPSENDVQVTTKNTISSIDGSSDFESDEVPEIEEVQRKTPTKELSAEYDFKLEGDEDIEKDIEELDVELDEDFWKF